MAPLRPCPFCDEGRIDLRGGLRLTWGCCDNCGTTGPTVPTASAADGWNRRPGEDRLLRALTAMLEETEGMVTVENRGLGLARYQALEAVEKATGAPFIPPRQKEAAR